MEAPYRPDVKGFMRMSVKEENDDEQGAEPLGAGDADLRLHVPPEPGARRA